MFWDKVVGRKIAIVIVIFATGVLDGCGPLGLCNNPCPAGWVHWGPDCGSCMQQGTSHAGPPAGPNNPYYVVRRFFCDGGAVCDHKYSGASCQSAINNAYADAGTIADPCGSCDGHTLGPVPTFPSGRQQGEFVQGDSCTGWSLNKPADLFSMNETLQRPKPRGIGNGGYCTATWKERDIIRAAFALSAANSAAFCQQKCGNGEAECIRLHAPPGALEGLRNLRQLLSSRPDIISAQQLTTMFNLAADPCERGNTVFRQGKVTNVGVSCTMSVSVLDINVEINVPDFLQGEWTTTGNMVEAIFDNPPSRGILHFDEPGLEQSYGGDIVSVTSDDNYINFAMQRDNAARCIGIALR